jgi:HK97 family phage major capsid protein
MLQDLITKRNKLVADIRATLDAAGDSPLTADQKRQVSEMEADCTKYDEKIGILERQDAREASLRQSTGRVSSDNALSTEDNGQASADAFRSFAAWAQCGPRTRTAAFERDAKRGGFNPENREYIVDLQARANAATTSGAVGGYLVADAIKAGLTKAQAQFGSVYGAARVIKTAQGNPIPFDLFNDLANEGSGVAQGGPSGYLDVSFDQVTLGSFKISSNAVAVSSELLRDSYFDVPGILSEALGRRIAVKANKWFTTGAGTTEPYGIVTGATWLRPANAASMSTTISTDQVLDLVHSIDPAYRVGAKFMCPDLQVLSLRKLKNEANDYVWQESTRVGEPSTLFGYPIVVNQAMAAPAANAKSLLFGALDNFVVREVGQVRIVRSDELLVLNDQTLFIAYASYDSRLINPGVTNLVRGHQYAQAES